MRSGENNFVEVCGTGFFGFFFFFRISLLNLTSLLCLFHPVIAKFFKSLMNEPG